MIDFQNGSIFKLKQVSTDSVSRDIAPLLVNSEEVLSSYKGVRDYVVFTSKRIIAVNVQGMTGKKKDFTSLPYSKVQAFSSETAGVFDMDSELELYFSGLGKVKFEFSGTSNIVQLSQIIGSYIL
ncbi:MAG: PH domain-containing protein [Muricomes sp.]